MQEYGDFLPLAIIKNARISEMTRNLGEKTAGEGTKVIEEKLDQLIESGRSGQINDMLPAVFLDAASLQLWKGGASIEPILYLYEKYYPIRVSTKDDEGTRVGLGFSSVMVQIIAEHEGEDRNILINTTIEFLTRHNKNMADYLSEITWFAYMLKENGLTTVAKQIANLLLEMHPNLPNQYPGLKKEMEEILS